MLQYFISTATCCNGWKELSVMKPTKTVQLKIDKKDNKKETRGNGEKALEEPIEANVNEFFVAVYERKAYVGKVERKEGVCHDIDENESLQSPWPINGH